MISTSGGSSDLAKLEELKTIIRSLLIAENNSLDVTLEKLRSLYREQIDEDIPYKDFGFTSLREFLASIPDVVYFDYNKNKQLCVYHVESERSKHISELISKERKRTQPNSRRNLILSNNRIDLHVLLKILREAYAYAKLKRKSGISKMDVLGRVKNYVGHHSSYTHENLSSQLNEFTHLLTHDDDFIFFKPKSCNSYMNEAMQKKSHHNRKSDEFPVDSISDFIKDTIKTRLKLLLKKHPCGIWSNDLPKVFQQEFRWDLKYYDLGFSSIIEFVSALPHIMKLITPPNARKQLVVSAQKNSNMKNVLRYPVSKSVESTVIWGTDPIPSELSPEVSKLLIPSEFLSFDETVEQIFVTSLQSKYIDVIVSDVKNPSWFWVNLRENKRTLDKLMNELQEFYALQHLNKFRVSRLVVRPGLHVACVYAGMWHRGIIKNLRKAEKDVSILFYDFGTVYHYKLEDIYFLDKRFSTVPVQAIPCSLFNVRPTTTAKTWPYDALKQFSRRVCSKEFVARIIEVDPEHNFLSINLIDTSSEDDVEIDSWMFANDLGKPGEFSHSRCNAVFDHYLHCLILKKDDHTAPDHNAVGSPLETKGCQPNVIVEESETQQSSISMQKKLAFLKKYKERSLNSSFASNNASGTRGLDESNNLDISKTSESFSEDLGYGDSPTKSDNQTDRRDISENSQSIRRHNHSVSSSLSSSYVVSAGPSEFDSSYASTSRSNSLSCASNNNDMTPSSKISAQESVRVTVDPNSCFTDANIVDLISCQKPRLQNTLQELQQLIISSKN
ncbi:hypothetical protein QAD02_023147 [Eretmocerus hayati]|uniref:Uncharacterized protein n=1 Tax=Eretmocerus hayati TaxID=131215 RepID=A0ACC2PV40_9HYME|nr:hypothetical protein QAD02_023147 [Eretmocerus hayati]